MTPLERLAIAILVLAVGVAIGYLLRSRLRPSSDGASDGGADAGGRVDLPPGLALVTAPFCTRCTHLRERLGELRASARTVDAAANGPLLRDLDITSAPTLLVVGEDGRVVDRESLDFSVERLGTLVSAAGAWRS